MSGYKSPKITYKKSHNAFHDKGNDTFPLSFHKMDNGGKMEQQRLHKHSVILIKKGTNGLEKRGYKNNGA